MFNLFSDSFFLFFLIINIESLIIIKEKKKNSILTFFPMVFIDFSIIYFLIKVIA